MPARRKSRSKSGSPRRVRRSPKRRAYKGTDAHLYGSKERVYGVADPVTLSAIWGGFIAFNTLFAVLIVRIKSSEEEPGSATDNIIQSIWNQHSDGAGLNGKDVMSLVQSFVSEFPKATPDLVLTEDHLRKVVTPNGVLTKSDVDEIVTDFTGKTLALFIYCLLSNRPYNEIAKMLADTDSIDSTNARGTSIP